MWTSHPEFQELVRQTWSEEILGTRQFVLCRKLKSLKYPLKQLNRRDFSHISEKAEAARTELETYQGYLHDRPSDTKQNVVFTSKRLNALLYVTGIEPRGFFITSLSAMPSATM